MSDQTPVKPDQPVGIVCRQCGCAHFYTLETRKAAGGKITRRRQCRYCGKRITTSERVLG